MNTYKKTGEGEVLGGTCAPLFPFPLYLLAALLLAAVVGCRQAAPTLAITHVAVIDATGAQPKPDTSVVITGQKIVAVGPANSTPVPPGAATLDATGKFLIPGLVDSHVHLTAAGEPSGSRDFVLRLLVANGITTVRDMGGKVEYLAQLRREINHGGFSRAPRTGPQIFFTGPYLDGDYPSFLPSIVVKSAADARKAVDDLTAQGVDFIKTQSGLSREAYFAIAQESKVKHIRFLGHVPDRVSALEASNAGQASIEHLTGVLLACSAKEDELRQEQFAAGPPNASPEQSAARMRAWQRKLLDTYSPQKADELFQAFVRNETWQVPTFPMLVHLAYMTPETNLAAEPDMKYVPQNERKIWQQAIQGQLEHASTEDFALRQEMVKRSLEIVGKMQTAGVRIMAGTDLPAPNVLPGFSLHEDLAYLVQAGLTPVQALQAATKNPAEFLGKLPSQGTIEPGKFADLVLLDANPLDDIRNTQKINAVVLRGQLLLRPTLDGMLVAAESYATLRPHE